MGDKATKTQNSGSSLESNANMRVLQGKMEEPTLKLWHKVLYIIYFMALFFLLTFLLLRVWPQPAEPPGEVKLILVVAIMGALGGCVYSMNAFVYHVGKGTFKISYTCWYILRPLIGSILAVIFYFAFRGAFFSFSASTEDLNIFGIATLGGIVGIFSWETMKKLEELFDRIIPVEESGQELTGDTSTENSTQKEK